MKTLTKGEAGCDVRVENHGNIFLFYLWTQDAQDWVEEHVGPEALYWGENALVVEHRYAYDLSEELKGYGLEVV